MELEVQSVYRNNGLNAYGETCEFDGCGWNEAKCDVHHISYKEQQAIERKIRSAAKRKDHKLYNQLMRLASEMGFFSFDHINGQLAKDDRSKNLAVLCPNHHRYVHEQDLGMEILKHLPKRK